MKLPIKLNPKDSITVFLVAFVLIAIPLTVVTVLTQRDQRSNAAGTANFSLFPSTQTINQNTQFTVDILLDSTTDTVKGGTVVLSYPTTMLDLVPDPANGNQYTASGSLYTLAPMASSAVVLPSGVVGIVFLRTATPYPSGAGQKIARVTFKSKATVGAAVVNFSSFVSGVNSGTYSTTAVNGSAVALSVLSNGGTYTVVDPPPTVSITSPTANTGVVNGTYTVVASATDNNSVARVDFYIDGSTTPNFSDPTPDAGTSNYSFAWNTTVLTNSSHTIKAIAVDSGGNSSTASTVNVMVDNSNPTVTLTAPTASATPYRGSLTVSAIASDNRALANVQFYVDGGVTPITTITTAPFTFSWNTASVANAQHILTAKATDTIVGNSATSAPVTIIVDNQAPTVPVLTATPSSTTQINLSWTASTDTQSSVSYDVYRNSVRVNPTSLTTTTYSDIGLTAVTSYNYYIVSKDIAGNSSSSIVVTATTKIVPKFGDVNGDGRVNILDVSQLIDKWGATNKPIEDLNQDGRVDILDISLIIDNWF